PPTQDTPKPHIPIRSATREERDHTEAVKLFGLACFHELNNRLIEAMRTFEEALRLDSRGTPIYRALVPLYIALERNDDALAACKRIRELDPADYETGYLYARQLRGLDRVKEARTVLAEVARLPGLKEQPDLHAQVAFDLGALHETAGDWSKAEAAF